MIPGAHSTPESVGRDLIDAFRAMQGVAIYSQRKDAFQPLFGERVAGLDLVSFTAPCLGREALLRRQLLTWASCTAKGESVAEVCREFGWPRATFERHRERALQIVADCLNRTRSQLMADALAGLAPRPVIETKDRLTTGKPRPDP